MGGPLQTTEADGVLLITKYISENMCNPNAQVYEWSNLLGH